MIKNARPDIVVHVPREDRIRVQVRLMEELPETKGKLDEEEKIAFAYCIYTCVCIQVYDEERDRMCNGIVLFDTFEHIKSEFEYERQQFPSRFKIEKNNSYHSFHLSGTLSVKSIEVPYITYNEINMIIPDQSGTSFSFNYTPEDLKAGHRQKFQIKVKVDGLEYPPFNESVDFSHKSSFKISTPDKVSLDENGYCQFYVYITNLSEQKSDKCEVYVDGKLVKTQDSFNGGQRIAASVTKRINMEDEDLKTMMLNIRVVEKGCPEYVDSKKVIFERYYANN